MASPAQCRPNPSWYIGGADIGGLELGAINRDELNWGPNDPMKCFQFRKRTGPGLLVWVFPWRAAAPAI